MLAVRMSPFNCVTPSTSIEHVSVRFLPLEANAICRFEGVAVGSMVLIACVSVVEAFVPESESRVPVMVGSAVMFWTSESEYSA